MVYRAKCTHIIATLENVMNFKNYTFVKDCQDKYIEVKDEDLAQQIELIEETTVKLSLQTMRLKDLISNGY